MRAYEKDRRLIVEVGGDIEDFVIEPVPARDGSRLFAMYAEIAFAQVKEPNTPESVSIEMARLALGSEEAYARLEELRSAESTAVINAAVFWNAQGGGIALVRAMLEADGDPKAGMEILMRNNGLHREYAQLMTLLDGGLESLIQSPDASPDTATPAGTSTSSTATTVDRLPRNRRSVGQNQG